jgi:hypothetical protein
MISPELKKIIVDKSLGMEVTADPLLLELLDIYMNDVNSSTLRELITIELAGYESLPGKLGRDGVDPITNKPKEAKPKNFTGKASNGGGCFNDYTQQRLNKDVADDLDIVHSLFVDGKIAYIVEFNIDAIKGRLSEQIIKKCVIGKNDYVRSASWNYKYWVEHDSLKVHYIDPTLLTKSKTVVRDLWTALMGMDALRTVTVDVSETVVAPIITE